MASILLTTTSVQRRRAWADGGSSLPDGVTIAGLWALVIDDEEEARAMLAKFLSLTGAVVIAASSGAEALDVLTNATNGRGLTFLCAAWLCRRKTVTLRCSHCVTLMRRAARGVAASGSIPAIALPTLASDEDRLRALSAGFQFHFAEPADPVELTIVIANLAGMWL